MTRDQEQESKESMCSVFGKNKLNERVRQWMTTAEMLETHLVQLVAQINRIDVVAFEV